MTCCPDLANETPSTASAPSPQCRIKVEYDGRPFHGWQIQANAPTVQEELEKALQRLTERQIRIRGAGRTDAGVHARGQVASFPMPANIPIEAIPAALNSRLPAEIAVTAAELADSAFDPRRHCLLKQYSYSFAAGGPRPALGAGRCWRVKWPLDYSAMREASGYFLGTHDFTSFANREEAEKDNVREVKRCELVELTPDAAGRPRWVLHVEGRSFLYNMVRAIAGTLVGVGAGRFAPQDVCAMLKAMDRAVAGMSAPPWGLCLEWIIYPGEEAPADRNGLFEI